MQRPYLQSFFTPLVILFIFALAGNAHALPWQRADPASAGWSIERLAAAQTYAASLKPTAVMVVQDGKIIANWGAALVSGYGGQAIVIVPSKRMVVVQIVDSAQNPKGVRTSHFVNLLQQITAAAP